MRPSLLVSTVLFSSFLVFGCGGGDDGDGGDGGIEVDPDGTHYQFVADTLLVPGNATETANVAFDIDGDGTEENAAGGLLSALANALGLDIGETVQTYVDNGVALVLADMQTTDLVAASGVGMRVFQGADPSPAGCTDEADPSTCRQHLDGNGSFSIATTSPTDALVVGSLVGGHFTGGPGTVNLELPLANGVDPVSFDLLGARMEADVAADGSTLTAGKLGGAVTEDDIRNEVLPAVTDVLASLIARDCTGAFPECCEDEESTGGQILAFFNENPACEEGSDGCEPMDCEVTQVEIESNSLVSSTLLNPDLDLLDADGELNPNSDGIEDSLSIAVGFTAVSASYDLP